MILTSRLYKWSVRSMGACLCIVLPAILTGCGDRADDMTLNSLNAINNAYSIYNAYELEAPETVEPDDSLPPEARNTPSEEPIILAESQTPRGSRYASADSVPTIPEPPPLEEDEIINPFVTEEPEDELTSELGEQIEETSGVDTSTDTVGSTSDDIPDTGSNGEDDTAALLTQALVNALVLGMNYEDARDIIGFEGTVISTTGNDEEIIMYRWSDSRDANFMARFESDKLTRKTNLHIPASPDASDTETVEAEESAENDTPAPRPRPRPTAVQVESEHEAEPETILDAQEEQSEIAINQADVDRNNEFEQVNEENWQTEQEEQFVTTETEPYQQAEAVEEAPRTARVQLPGFRRSLRNGIHNLRINNPAPSAVQVGIRTGTQGRDVNVAAGGSQTLRLEQGTYQIFYIYRDEPSALLGGGSVTLESFGLPDADITLMDGGFSVYVYDPMHN